MSGIDSLLPMLMMGGGSVLGGLSSLFGANQQNRAIRRADDDNALRLRGQQGLFGAGIFGSAFGQQPTWQTLYGQGLERQDQNLINQGLSGMNSFIDQMGGPVIQQQRGLAEAVSQRQTGNRDFFDRETQRLGQMAGADRDSLMRGFRDLEGMASQWGAGRAQTIRRDAGRDLSRANQLADRTLMNRGLGNSSLIVGAQRANQRASSEARDDALTNLGMQQLDRMMGARAGGLGAFERTGQSQLGREYQRASDRMGLEERNLTRDIALRQDPINTMWQALSSGIMNPYGQVNFGPAGASGSAAILSSLGGSLQGAGNYMSNQNFLNELLNRGYFDR